MFLEREGNMTQYAFANLPQKSQRCLDESYETVDFLLMNLSKACDCVHHKLVAT